MEKITFKKGESISIGFLLNSEYDMARIQSCSAWVGGKKFPLATIGQMLRCEIKSTETHLLAGKYKLILWIDDSVLGIKKIEVADVEISFNHASDNNSSINEGYDFVFNITINETAIEAGDVLYNYVKGDNADLPDGIVIDSEYWDDKERLENTSGTNTGDQDLSPYQTITDALLETDSNTIVGAINEVNSIAKGANQALSFNDYQAVIAAMLVSGLNAGQNLYVDNLDVPDLWVKVVEVASIPYTYVSDEQFITDILAGTQIGYYRLALLETQKVDLTNYYTKDETDQAIEDYAEPLRTTDQNYVSDAELEVLQDTSGVNTGDETQDSLGEKIELTELETVTDTTKIAASDSAFLKWFSGLTIYTYLKGKFDSVYATIANYFSKTESDRRFVNQNGGTIYHITRWFTPTSALTIAANGLSATITSGQFNSAMTGSQFRITNGINEPIITYVNSNNISFSFAVDDAFKGQTIAIADWGVYSKSIENTSDSVIIRNTYGIVTFYNGYGETYVSGTGLNPYAGSKWKITEYFGYMVGNSASIGFSSVTSAAGTKDTGLRRSASGLLEIFDGTTNGVLRDLKLRSLYADKVMLNAINTAPSSATDTGTAGEIRIDANYIYFCVATNQWKRTPLSTW